MPVRLSADDLNQFVRLAVLPVLQETPRNPFSIIQNKAQSSVTLSSPNGDYTFRLTADPSLAYPRHGLPVVIYRGDRLQAEFTVLATHDGDYASMDRVAGIVRSALRAEPITQRKLNLEQIPVLSALLDMEGRTGPGGCWRGVVHPVASGKTFISAKYVQEIRKKLGGQPGWKNKPKVLAVLQNNAGLDHIVQTYSEELGLTKIAKLYDESSQNPTDLASEMIAITRTTYFKRRSEIHALLQADTDQPWVIVFDEAHHLGKNGGQFEKILKGLNKIIDHRHRVLTLSATFWHSDKKLITKYLHGNVVGGFLNPNEQQQLEQGEDLVSLCRLQFYRMIARGYSPPFFGIHMVRSVDGWPASAILGKEFLRSRAVAESLARDIKSRIVGDRRVHVYDRGVLFAPSIDHANLYAELLSKSGLETRALHSETTTKKATLNWFSDKGDFDSEADRKIHKYIVVVDMLNEAVDIPKINMAVLLSPFSMYISGFKELIQALGRSSRPAEGKIDVRIYDYTLHTRWLRDGLSQIMVERPPSNRLQHPVSRTLGLVVIQDDGKEVLRDPVQFNAQYDERFPEDLEFTDRHPCFDVSQFEKWMVPALEHLAFHLGVKNLRAGGAIVDLLTRLTNYLPDLPEKDELLEWLKEADTLKKWDGARILESPPDLYSARRVYEVLYEIARVLEYAPQPTQVDLSRLLDPAELDRLWSALLSYRISALASRKDIQIFLEPETGGLALFMAEAKRQGFVGGPKHDPKNPAKDFCIYLANQAYTHVHSPALRAKLDQLVRDLADDELWGWVQNDGTRDLKEMKTDPSFARPAQKGRNGWERIYAALSALADLLRQTKAKELPKELLSQQDIGKLLDLLISNRSGIYFTAPQFETCRKETLDIVRRRMENFGINNFQLPFSTRTIAVEAAKLLPEGCPNKKALVRYLASDDYGWTKNAGLGIIQGSRLPTEKFLNSLYLIAKELSETDFGRGVINPNQIFAAQEMSDFLNVLVLGFTVPLLKEKDMDAIQNVVNPFGLEVAPRFGATPYVLQGGPRKLALAWANRIPATNGQVEFLRNRLLFFLEHRWGWTDSDADVINRFPNIKVCERLDRALMAIATIQKLALREQATFDIQRLRTRRHLEVLALSLGDASQ
ncbi:MAG: DEAD/DEAH box helicase family protein [Deltaproteobacteria bacterium]|nr:DEAD/DEAH box helicase family protein [Deltaproteobacteria bacterium]